MSRSPTIPESLELIQLRQQALLKEFLGNVKKMIKVQAEYHLQDLDKTQRSLLTRPQVFISYAWEANGTPKLTHLQTLLTQLQSDLAATGIITWFDKQQMTGHIEEQMRNGIRNSQYVLLIGTHRYAERTQPESKTNVRKELDFTLDEAKKSPDFLLPLMLEGDYGTTFPTIGQYLIRNCRSWYSLEQGQWQSQENYIKDLTKSDSEGILYCLLGLNRCERELIKYRQACVKQYRQLQQALMNALELLQARQPAKEIKSSPSRPSIQLTPVLQIPFKELEYDKKADKIGSGSYGEVYRGWWQGKYSVAVKELTGTLTTEAEKDLHREAGIMAHMAKVSTEPYPTVRLFGIAVEKPSYALVMEYVPNGTLFDLLQLHNETKLPWDLYYQLAADIAEGIALLHCQNILHRDLRSHNVLLNINEGRLRAKLSDFGLSTVKSSIRTYSTVTRKTENVGARAWMAPELHKRGGQPSPASDVYSFGMVLWELLTHAIPFADAQGDTSLISDWVTKGETEAIPRNCPPQLAELVKKCWVLKPEDRILMGDIQKKLTELLRMHPLSSETQAIIETLKKNQEEREAKWNVHWHEKHQAAKQKQKESEQQQQELEKIKHEMAQLKSARQQIPIVPETSTTEELHEVKIKKQAEITQLQQQHQAEQLALQKQMEQLKLAQEQQKYQLEMQKRAAAEEKRLLEIEKQEKQKEIERLKQQHQTELKRSQEDIKHQSPLQVQSPKPATQAEQLKLQNQLIIACKQGDEEGVITLLELGAKPDMVNARGEQPLGAAVWSMCPDVVDALLKKAGDTTLMTWEQCEKHNIKFYKEIFIVPKFDPQTYKEWNILLQKIDSNRFIRIAHLKKVDEAWLHKVSSSWDNLRKYMQEQELHGGTPVSPTWAERYGGISWGSEKEFMVYRRQIQQSIEAPWRLQVLPDLPGTSTTPLPLTPTMLFVEKKSLPINATYSPITKTITTSSHSLTVSPASQSRHTLMPASKPVVSLQDQLIDACKQGDEKAVMVLLRKGAKSNIPNTQSEQPFGAAIWGMCPGVVSVLLKQTGGVAPMTWAECEEHNLKYYQEVFIVPKFEPHTYAEWYELLQKIDSNLFIRAFHLKKVSEKWWSDDDYSSSWEVLKGWVECRKRDKGYGSERVSASIPNSATEEGYSGFRKQIKQGVLMALQNSQFLMPAPTSIEQLQLQDQLIAACKLGDEKTVTELLKRGAKSDMATLTGEKPLGAAVWGMCPDIVNALLEQRKGVISMTWEECERHNKKYYDEVFTLPKKFDQWTYDAWHEMGRKIGHNIFLNKYHNKVEKDLNDYCEGQRGSVFDIFSTIYAAIGEKIFWSTAWWHRSLFQETEKGHENFRSQIKQAVITASRPKTGQTFS